MMTKVYKRTSLVVSTVCHLRHGCQMQAFLEKEWHMKLSSDDVKSQRKVSLEAKVKEVATNNRKLEKENCALKEAGECMRK